MAYVASKQHTTALFSFHHSYTHKKTHRTERKLTNLMGNLCYAREHSVQFFVQFFYTVELHSLTESVWGLLGCMGPFRVYGAP